MNILIATDFSYNAEKACKYALETFNHEENVFTILHTVFIRYAGALLTSNLNTDLSEYADKKINEYAAGLRAEYPNANIKTVIEIGPLSAAIANHIDNETVDLLVFGTNGVSRVFEKIVGSNTSKMMDATTVPMLVIPVMAEMRKPKKVLFTTDHKNEKYSDRLSNFIKIFSKLDASLDVLYIGEEGESAKIAALLDKQRLPSGEAMAYTKHVRPPEIIGVEDQILNFAEEQNSDLIVAVPHHENFFTRLLHHSVTKELAAISKRPLLILK